MGEFLLILAACCYSAFWWHQVNEAKEQIECDEGIRKASALLVFFTSVLIVAFLVSIFI